MEREQIIWQAGDRAAVAGNLGRIESVDRFYGYLVNLDDGSFVNAQRDEIEQAPLFDASTAARGDRLDASKSPVENYLRIVR